MKRKLQFSLVATAAVAMAATLLLSQPTFAQQAGRGKAKGPSKPTPKLADGKVDLGNGTGIWAPIWVQDWADTKWVEKAVDVPFSEKGLALFKERRATLSKDDPEGYCLPPGVPRYTGTPYPFQLYQLKDRVLMIHESMHGYRIIMLSDTHKQPPLEDLNPNWLGHSIGWYEDDGQTLVVDTIGFNGKTWLDYVGHPTSEDLHVVERITRPNFDTLHYETTIEDKQMYTKPWTSSFNVRWRDGQELMEYICNENNKDLHHLGTESWK